MPSSADPEPHANIFGIEDTSKLGVLHRRVVVEAIEGEVMEPLKDLVHRAFRRSYKKKAVPEGQTPIAAAVQQAASDAEKPVEEAIEQVDPEGVARFACMLEAMLAMGEQVPDDHVLQFEAPLGDLRSFVSYMRELDASYRKVLDLATGEIAKQKEKRERPNLILPPGARK